MISIRVASWGTSCLTSLPAWSVGWLVRWWCSSNTSRWQLTFSAFHRNFSLAFRSDLSNAFAIQIDTKRVLMSTITPSISPDSISFPSLFHFSLLSHSSFFDKPHERYFISFNWIMRLESNANTCATITFFCTHFHRLQRSWSVWRCKCWSDGVCAWIYDNVYVHLVRHNCVSLLFISFFAFSGKARISLLNRICRFMRTLTHL